MTSGAANMYNTNAHISLQIIPSRGGYHISQVKITFRELEQAGKYFSRSITGWVSSRNRWNGNSVKLQREFKYLEIHTERNQLRVKIFFYPGEVWKLLRSWERARELIPGPRFTSTERGVAAFPLPAACRAQRLDRLPVLHFMTVFIPPSIFLPLSLHYVSLERRSQIRDVKGLKLCLLCL